MWVKTTGEMETSGATHVFAGFSEQQWDSTDGVVPVSTLLVAAGVGSARLLSVIDLRQILHKV